jgi:mono/diheme cytochrome c family protein
MKKLFRYLGYGVGGLVAIALFATLAIYFLSERSLGARPTPAAAHLVQPSPAQLADGPRQLHVLGCLSCHGKGLQGEVFLDEPGTAKLYAPNLTLVAAKATDQQLEQAIRQGIGHDGRSLLVMPAEGYQFMTDDEVAAVIAAIRALPRGGGEKPRASIALMGRLGVVLGKFHTAPELVRTFRKTQAPDFGPKFAEGRHIVVTNCAECHGPQLHGQEVEPGVVSPDMEIAGAYDLDQFRAMLRTGVGPGGKDLGLMGRVAKSDFSHLTDAEIAQVHAYLTERARRKP